MVFRSWSLPFLLVWPVLLLFFQNCGRLGSFSVPTSADQIVPVEDLCLERASDVRVGAIRWDAWNGHLPSETSTPNDIVLNSLGNRIPQNGVNDPWRFKSRWPFFASFDQTGLKSLDSTGSLLYEARIAQAAGVDYWAFLEYNPESSLSTAIKEYETMVPEGLVNFSLIFNANSFLQVLDTATLALKPQPEVDAYFERVKNRMRDSRYEKLPGHRPLAFVYSDFCTYTYGSWNPSHNDCFDLAWFFNRIKVEAVAAGLGEPYFVYLSSPQASTEVRMSNMGLSALSSYTIAPSANKTYADFLADHAAGPYQDFLISSTPVTMPIVFPATAGWNPGPRFACMTGQCWNTVYGSQAVAQDGTSQEVAQGIFDVIKKSEQSARTELVGGYKTALVYAWNEFDEGGWLAPTLTPALDAVDQSRAYQLGLKLKPNCEFKVKAPALKQ